MEVFCNRYVSTLCWSCQRATNKPGFGCSWSRNENPKPVDGWSATQTWLKFCGEITESFIVHKCPEFLPDKVRKTYECNRVYYTYKGRTMTLGKWSRVSGININTLRHRIRNGMPFEEAITREVKKQKWRELKNGKNDKKDISGSCRY